MRCRRGERTQANDESHVESARGIGDDVDEITPVKVRFGANEKEDVSAIAVVAVAQLDLGPREFGGDAVDDASERPTCALVNEVFGIEGC